MAITLEQERNLISLRRSKVSELLSKGYTSGADIARIINVSEPTISRDLKYIREQAREYLQTFTQERLSDEFKIAIDTYDYVIRSAAHTADTTQDERTRNEALKIVRDTRSVKQDLISNHDIIQYRINKDKQVEDNNTEPDTEEQTEEELINEDSQ